MLAFEGKILNGQFAMEPDEEIRHDNYVGTLKGEQIRSYERLKKSGTDRQRKYYFGVIVAIFTDWSGYTRSEAHKVLAYQFLKRYDDKDNIKYIESYADLSTKQREDYHEEIRRYMSIEHDLYIPLPNETRYNYDWIKYIEGKK